jgi:peptidoglycan/LPS O-acetylase OafA/YrhL
MTESHDNTEALSLQEGILDPREAAALLTQTKEKASQALQVNSLMLSILGGVVLPVGFGIIWWSVRHQHPYQGPTLGAIGLFYLTVLLVDGISIAVFRRSSRGVGGQYKKNRRMLTAVGAVGLIGAYVIMGALEHAHVSHLVVYGIYPATVPLVIGGMIGAVGASQREDWTLFTAALAISCIAAGAAFAGPVGAWAVSGFGSGAALLGSAGVKLIQRRAR